MERYFSYYSIIEDLETDAPNYYMINRQLALYKAADENDLDIPIAYPATRMVLGELAIKKFTRNILIFTNYGSLGDFDQRELLEIHNYEASNLTLALWFIKDCSCNLDFSVVVNMLNHKCGVLTNHTHYTNAIGIRKSTFFSKQELDKAKEYVIKLNSISTIQDSDLKSYNADNGRYMPTMMNYRNYYSFSKIDRATYFLNEARKSAFVLSKISNYVILLEALFGAHNDSAEVTYKISHRVAAYLEPDNKLRKPVFKLLSKFYGFRSKFLHGQVLPNARKKTPYTREEILEISVEVDNLIRKIFLRVLESPEPFLVADEEKFQSWLTDLYYS